jgi:hypothetical protein
VSEDRVRSPDKPRDDFREIRGVVLGIVRRRGDVIAFSVSTEVEKDAAILRQLLSYRTPDAAVTTVAVKAEKRDGAFR